MSGTSDMPYRTPMVLVTLGTDHHRFERLMDWVELWMVQHLGAVRIVIQHGFSRLPAGAEGFPLCSRDEILDLMSTADVVVTQGGPGGIMDSRDSGILPIVVPRLASFDEAVDDHQVSFCTHMAGKGLVVVASSQGAFDSELDRALADPRSMRIDVTAAASESAIRTTGELIEALVRDRPSRFRRPHVTG